jgi:hypothetical protein
MAQIQELNSDYIKFKESFFKVRRIKKQDSFIESLKRISADSSIIEFYKQKQFSEIVNQELRICPREEYIKKVHQLNISNNQRSLERERT